MILAKIPIVCTVVDLYSFVFVVAILMSWFAVSADSPFASVFRALRTITDPVLEPLRRVIPPLGGVIDISPMIVILVLQLVIHPLVCG